MMQLDFFNDPEKDLHKDVDKLRNQYDTLRKSQFARLAELKRMYDETQHELNQLKEAMGMVKTWGDLFERKN